MAQCACQHQCLQVKSFLVWLVQICRPAGGPVKPQLLSGTNRLPVGRAGVLIGRRLIGIGRQLQAAAARPVIGQGSCRLSFYPVGFFFQLVGTVGGRPIIFIVIQFIVFPTLQALTMMRYRYFIIMTWLLLAPALYGRAGDTLLIVDRLAVWLPGVQAAQVLQPERRLRLYQPRWQLGLAAPGMVLRGTALLWHRQAWGGLPPAAELGLSGAADVPRRWRKAVPGTLLIDTLLPIGEQLQCWLRVPGGPAWRLLTVERPALRPRWAGYLLKAATDTAELRARQQQVAMQLPAHLPWRPPGSGLPVLAPGYTAELLLQPRPGLPDSSLEYRLLPTEGPWSAPAWQPTGHLLRLPALPAGRTYQLELRYRGYTDVLAMPVVLAPRWYQRPWRLAALLLALAAIAVLYQYLRYRRRLQRSQQNHDALQDQLRRLEAQLNPHFVYNSLSSIGGLMAQQKYQEAHTYLSEFGRLLRETISYSKMDQLYTLEAELNMLQHYCRLEQLRFGFTYELTVDPQLDPTGVQLPPMLTQPLVENAIRHGVQRLASGGHIGISYSRHGADFEVRVTDNGPGLHNGTTHNGTGTGLQVTRQRIAYLNALYGRGGIHFGLAREQHETVASIRFVQWLE